MLKNKGGNGMEWSGERPMEVLTQKCSRKTITEEGQIHE